MLSSRRGIDYLTNDLEGLQGHLSASGICGGEESETV